MRIADELYFAPRIKFSDIALRNDSVLASQLYARLFGFYLEPAYILIDKRYAFAAGVIIVTCIDALSRFEFGTNVGTNKRFPDWCTSKLPSFKDGYSQRFYKDFRNGLVHEGRVKKGGEFTFDRKQAVTASDETFSINPEFLIEEVVAALDEFTNRIVVNSEDAENLKNVIESDFEYELS